jgi:hypothetical protein
MGTQQNCRLNWYFCRKLLDKPPVGRALVVGIAHVEVGHLTPWSRTAA